MKILIHSHAFGRYGKASVYITDEKDDKSTSQVCWRKKVSPEHLIFFTDLTDDYIKPVKGLYLIAERDFNVEVELV